VKELLAKIAANPKVKTGLIMAAGAAIFELLQHFGLTALVGM